MIRSGGTTVIGISITACLTTFEHALKSLNLSNGQIRRFANFVRFMRFKPVSDSKTSIYQFALSLDKLINPRFWGTLPVSQATALAHNFFWLSCCLHGVLGVGFGEEFLELSLYHTASHVDIYLEVKVSRFPSASPTATYSLKGQP